MNNEQDLEQSLEEALVGEEEEKQEENEEKKEEVSSEAEEKQEGNEEKQEEQREDVSEAKLVYLADTSNELISSLAKIDAKIETLQNSPVSTDEFYSSLDTLLDDKEKELEYENKIEYLKLIEKKKKEFIKSKSNDEELNELLEQKEQHEEASKRVAGIQEVLAKYPEFDFEATQGYFHDDLTKKEQHEIMSKAESYADVYRLTYEKYKKINPVKVPNQKPPNIPNVNNARKKEANPKTITQEFKSEDELTKEALGL